MQGIYIHIPFCRKICYYCDFYKMIANDKTKDEFIKYLIIDLKNTIKKYCLKNIDTIYIGGGTPSSLSIEQLEILFRTLLETFELKKVTEFTIEVNPEDITDDLINFFKKYYISRISIGVQTFQKENYNALGRVTDFNLLKEKIKILKKHNFNNYSFDLIYAIPNSNINMLQNDLDKVLELKPAHISTYSLILKEKTILSHKLKKDEFKLIDEELDFEMYNLIKEIFKKNGYVHYETSNFSLPGYESKHNLIYWNCMDYYGIGPASASLINNIRFTKVSNLKKYYEFLNKKEEPTLEIEELCLERQMEDYIMMGLRKIKGINILDFKRRFKKDIFNVFKSISYLIESSLLKLDDNYLSINEKYIYISNFIISKILFD